MRRHNTQPLGQVIKEYLKALGIERKIKETGLISEWETIVGKAIARHTTEISIYNHVLFVKLNSSVVRN